MANIKSQQKRNITNKDKASELLASTSRKLDKAASKGVIHKNQAANKKSALAQALQKI